MTPEVQTHKHGSGRTAPYWVLSSECVVVVVGNYIGCSWIYEVDCPSACPFGFATRVEAMSPPGEAGQYKAGLSNNILLSGAFHDSGSLPLPVTFLFGCTFVVLSFATRESDFQLCVTFLPVERQCNDCHSFSLNSSF